MSEKQTKIKLSLIENKLYIAKDGQLSEYIASQGTSENDKNTYFDETRRYYGKHDFKMPSNSKGESY